jgi:hypothetical protein
MLAREILEEFGNLIHGCGRGCDMVRCQDRATAVVASPGRDVESVLLQLPRDPLDRRLVGKEQMMDDAAARGQRAAVIAIEDKSNNSHRGAFLGRIAWLESRDRPVNPALKLLGRGHAGRRSAARRLWMDVVESRAMGST